MAAGSRAGLHRRSRRVGVQSRPDLVRLFIRKINGVDDGIGALRRGGGGFQRFPASVVHSIGEDDDGFATLLLLEDFVGSKKNRVVKGGAAASPGLVAARLAAGRRIVIGLLDFHQVERGFQFLVRSGEVLEQLHFTVEVNDEGFILSLAHHIVEEAAAGSALLGKNSPLAAEDSQNPRRAGTGEAGIDCESFADGNRALSTPRIAQKGPRKEGTEFRL